MIFSDEKELWASEQETLAYLLANKSQSDIFDILNDYKSILVKVGKPKYTAAQRLIQILTVPLMPILLILMFVKWVLTGDKYLNSWLNRIGLTSERTDKYFM
tara:strand:- start:329 stop:634 length:306 start_codon:yes stop_codon:yes gene_type:complete